jgi:hypothetical protein
MWTAQVRSSRMEQAKRALLARVSPRPSTSRAQLWLEAARPVLASHTLPTDRARARTLAAVRQRQQHTDTVF